MADKTLTAQHATTLGIHPDVVSMAQASGISVSLLLQLLVTYGPQVLQVLAQIFGWTLPVQPLPLPPPPPLPVLPPPVTP